MNWNDTNLWLDCTINNTSPHNYYYYRRIRLTHKVAPMQISVIHEDGTENEFEIILCCPDCSNQNGWNINQHNKIYDAAIKGEIIKVPNDVTNEEQFIKFVRSL